MPSRRLRLPLVIAVAAVPLVVAGCSPPDAAPSTEAAAPASSPVAAPAVTVTVAPSLGPAMSITSPTPKPSATPDNGIHVHCAKGDDGNKGTLAEPLRTIRAATSRTLDPGSVIELARGCSWRTTVQLRGDGTRARPIRLTAYGTGAQPVIDGGSAGSESVVLLSGEHQIVENIHVTNAETNGV